MCLQRVENEPSLRIFYALLNPGCHGGSSAISLWKPPSSTYLISVLVCQHKVMWVRRADDASSGVRSSMESLVTVGQLGFCSRKQLKSSSPPLRTSSTLEQTF